MKALTIALMLTGFFLGWLGAEGDAAVLRVVAQLIAIVLIIIAAIMACFWWVGTKSDVDCEPLDWMIQDGYVMQCKPTDMVDIVLHDGHEANGVIASSVAWPYVAMYRIHHAKD